MLLSLPSSLPCAYGLDNFASESQAKTSETSRLGFSHFPTPWVRLDYAVIFPPPQFKLEKIRKYLRILKILRLSGKKTLAGKDCGMLN